MEAEGSCGKFVYWV